MPAPISNACSSQWLQQTVSNWLDKFFFHPYLYAFFSLICLKPRTLLDVDTLLASVIQVSSLPLFQVLTYVVFTVVFICYVLRWAIGAIERINRTFLCITCMFLSLTIITFLFDGASGYHIDWHAGFALMMMIDMGLQRERNSLIRGLGGAFEFWVYLNVISFVVFPLSLSPESPVKSWLLGSHVFYFRTVYPTIALAMVRHYVLGWKRDWRTACLLVACVITVLHQRGGTALIGAAVFGILLIWSNRRALPRYITPFIFAFLAVMVFICIQYFGLLTLFETLITQGLGKSLTLSNRTLIWDKTMSILFNNPITGIGYLPVSYMRELFWQWAPHTHNQILELMLHGGIISVLLYLMAVFFSSQAAIRYRRSPAVKITSILLCTFSVMGVVEIFHNDPIYYALFVFLSRSDCLVDDVKQLPRINVFTRIKRDIKKLKKR